LKEKLESKGELKGQTDTGAKSESEEEKSVKCMELYDVLGVKPSASEAEIKRAYYMRARENHPDKHRDDPEASKRFQVIGEAYQVLSDPQERARYDEGGRDATAGLGNDRGKVGAGELYALIFGSDKFEPLIGELKLASQMAAAADEEEEPARAHADFASYRQRKRVIRCALKLAEKLQRAVERGGTEMDRGAGTGTDSDEQLREEAATEAKELASTPFGGVLIKLIGTAYRDAAREQLHFADSYFNVPMARSYQSISTTCSMAKSGINAFFSLRKLNRIQQKGEANAAKAANGNADGNASPTTDASDAPPQPPQSAQAPQAPHDPPQQGQTQTPTSSTSTPQGSGAPAGASGEPSTEASDEPSIAEMSAADTAEVDRQMKNVTAHTVHTIWSYTKLDIISTLRQVSEKTALSGSMTSYEATDRALYLAQF
jgi:curved DNA-binding protein CbpA